MPVWDSGWNWLEDSELVARCKLARCYQPQSICLVTWLHLRTHHLWRSIKEVGLFSEDHLP